MPEQPADHTATSPIHSSQHYVPSSSSREAKSACALIRPVLSEAEMHKSVSQDVRSSMNARIANSHPGIGIITNMAPPHTGTHAPKTALRSIKLFHEVSFKKECLVVPKIFYKKMTKSQQNFGTKRTSTYLKYLTCKILHSFKYLLSLLPLLSLLLSL